MWHSLNNPLGCLGRGQGQRGLGALPSCQGGQSTADPFGAQFGACSQMSPNPPRRPALLCGPAPEGGVLSFTQVLVCTPRSLPILPLAPQPIRHLVPLLRPAWCPSQRPPGYPLTPSTASLVTSCLRWCSLHQQLPLLPGAPPTLVTALAPPSGVQGHIASGLIPAHLPVPSIVTFPPFGAGCHLPGSRGALPPRLLLEAPSCRFPSP